MEAGPADDDHPTREALEYYALEGDEGGLPGAERDAIEAHVKRCDACATALRTMRDFDFEVAHSVTRGVAEHRARNPRRGFWQRLDAFFTPR